MYKKIYSLFLILSFFGVIFVNSGKSQDLRIVPNSVTFEEGSYTGGDVIRRFRLAVINRFVSDPATVTRYRVEIHLSRDGAYNQASDPQDDFILHFFEAGPLSPGETQEFVWDQLVPYNLEGQFFVVARVETVTGTADPVLTNNDYSPTQGARINLIPTSGFDAGLVSKASSGRSPAGFSDSPSLSVDARYVAFTSTARDIAFTNGLKTTDFADVFVLDRLTNVSRRVSLSSSGTQANGNSYRPSISADGNLIVFHSDATNLVSSDTNSVSDVFFHDIRTGQTLRISEPDAEMLTVNSSNTQSNAVSFNATISSSPNGIFVVYESQATNLSQRTPSGALLPDTNRSQDVFIYDLNTTKTARLSISNNGAQAINSNPRLNGDSYGARISRDGRTVVFRSEATNLVAGDTNSFSDVFVYNRSVSGSNVFDQSGNTSLVRVNQVVDPATGLASQALRDPLIGGVFPDRGSSYFPDLSSNGRYVVYSSEASNLSRSPASIKVEIGVAGVVELELTGLPFSSSTLRVSDDLGTGITFQFLAPDVTVESPLIKVQIEGTTGDTAAGLAAAINSQFDNLSATVAGSIVTVTHSYAGYDPQVGRNARIDETQLDIGDDNLKPGDTFTINDGTTTKIYEAVTFGTPVTTVGNIPFTTAIYGTQTRDNLIGAINSSGSEVVARAGEGFFNFGPTIEIIRKNLGIAPIGFAVIANSSLIDPFDQLTVTQGTDYSTNAAANVYLTDRDFDGNGVYDEPGLVGSSPGTKSVLISRSPTGQFPVGDYLSDDRSYYRPDSLEPTISADGRFIAFRTLAVNLLPPLIRRSDNLEVANDFIAQFSEYNTTEDVYVHDRDPSLTNDPRLYDTADISQSFFRNTVNTRVSVNKFGYQTSGIVGQPAIPASRQPQISPDGRYIVFVSDADNSGGIAFDQTNMESLDSNQKRDVFFFDRRFVQDPVVDIGLPQASILSPVIGNTFPNGSAVILVASASDSNTNGTIANLEYFVNGLSIGNFEPGISDATAGRYSKIWNAPGTVGTYNLYAKVTDNDGNVATSPVIQVRTVVAVGQLPILNPDQVQTSRSAVPLGSSVTLSAGATDPDGRIVRVDFLANGQVIGSSSTAPFIFTWRPSAIGNFDIRAIAFDNSGNSRSTGLAANVVVADNKAPVAVLTEPATDISVRLGGSVNLGASVSDEDGTVVRAELFANGQSIKVFLNPGPTVTTLWTPTAVGTYTIVATVVDDLGEITTNTVSRVVTVNPVIGLVPTVSVQAPTVALDTSSIVSFRATASDSDGNIDRVQFFLNGQSIGLGNFSSATTTWVSPVVNFSSRGAGTYTITAVAVDNNDNQANSAAVTFVVTVSTVPSVFGRTVNEVFLSAVGRNATTEEQTVYLGLLGSGPPYAEDYEIAALLMGSNAFDSTGAFVINSYLAVFGEYPTFAAYQDGLAAFSGGSTTAAYIDSLYASGAYLAKFGPLPSFSVLKNRETFSSTVHANLTGALPSSTINSITVTSAKMPIDQVRNLLGLDVKDLLASRPKATVVTGTSEKTRVTAAFAGLTTPESVGTVVSGYIASLSGSTQIPTAVLSRARVAGIILTLNEPSTALSFRETNGLRSFALLDVAELYGTGTTDAAIKPIFRTLPASTSVESGSTLRFTATVISPAVFGSTSDISSKWTFNSRTTLTTGSNSTSVRLPEHILSYTIPNVTSANAGSYTLAVSNRFGTVTAPAVTASITPPTPNALPGTVALKVNVAFPSFDLGIDAANAPGLSYVVTNLPRGLSLNSKTGVISGTPTRAGSFTITYYSRLGRLKSVTQRSNFIVTN